MRVALVIPAVLIMSSMVDDQRMRWGLLIPISGSIAVLAATLPQYYQLRTDGLFIKQGWHRSLIAYDALLSAKAVDSTLSSGVFSAARIGIETKDGRNYLIAPNDRSLFLEELAQRAPQIAERPRLRFGSF